MKIIRKNKGSSLPVSSQEQMSEIIGSWEYALKVPRQRNKRKVHAKAIKITW